MKKRTIIALIVAAALILTGGILLVLGLSFAGDGTRESKLVRKEITIQESFDHIAIDTEDCNVKFAMFSGRADTQVTIRQYPRIKHSVLVEDGVLKIKMTDNRKWYDKIGIFWEEMDMIVYLPAAEYESLQVRTDTGDITILEEPSFKEMMLRSITGDISCAGVRGDVLDCMTSTGDISVRDSAPVQTKLQSDTGDLEISGCEVKEIHMTTNTGEVDVQNVNAQMFTCSSDTGDVELEQVLVKDYLQIRTTTGDVGIESCDAGSVNIETDTGDVSGNFLTSKRFSANSDTGSVRVPKTREGGECRIESNTGDIHFE